jgi:hypothetical protein
VKVAAGALLACALAGAMGWTLSRYRLVLRVPDPVNVAVVEAVPLRASVAQAVDVRVDQDIVAQAKLGALDVPVDQTLRIPLHADLDLPVDAQVSVDQAFDLALDVPIHTVLSEHELRIADLVVPLDTDVFVDDVLQIETTIPLDTHVTTTLGVSVPIKGDLPVRARVPIHQKVHLRDNLSLKVEHLTVPLDATIPVVVHVPFKQDLSVRGRVNAKLREPIDVPIRHTLHLNLNEPVAVNARFTGSLPAQVTADLHTTVDIDRPLRTRLGPIAFGAGDLRAEPRETTAPAP